MKAALVLLCRLVKAQAQAQGGGGQVARRTMANAYTKAATSRSTDVLFPEPHAYGRRRQWRSEVRETWHCTSMLENGAEGGKLAATPVRTVLEQAVEGAKGRLADRAHTAFCEVPAAVAGRICG